MASPCTGRKDRTTHDPRAQTIHASEYIHTDMTKCTSSWLWDVCGMLPPSAISYESGLQAKLFKVLDLPLVPCALHLPVFGGSELTKMARHLGTPLVTSQPHSALENSNQSRSHIVLMGRAELHSQETLAL